MSTEPKPKTCKEIKAECDRAWHAAHTVYDTEIHAALLREFPLGTKVRFHHGLKWIEGVVTKYGEFDFMRDKVIVRNTKTKAEHEKRAHEIELVPVPERAPLKLDPGEERSSCCNAPVSVEGEGTGDDVTHNYSCNKCGKACDLQ